MFTGHYEVIMNDGSTPWRSDILNPLSDKFPTIKEENLGEYDVDKTKVCITYTNCGNHNYKMRALIIGRHTKGIVEELEKSGLKLKNLEDKNANQK